MRRICGGLEALLFESKSIPDCWIVWCPQVDVLTQGDHPDHAVALLEEAIRLVIESSINDLSIDDAGSELRRKRVVHPARLGVRAAESEDWPTYQRLLKMRESGQGSYLDLVDLDGFSEGPRRTALVSGDYWIETRSGVFKVDVSFDTYGYVPPEPLKVSD
jgi:predicted RNase H-like HicB family nuclease